MTTLEKLDTYLKNPPLSIDLRGKNLIFTSDWHKGNGGKADNFKQNEKKAIHILNNFGSKGYVFVSLGDIYELWQFHKDDIEWKYPIIKGILNNLFYQKRLIRTRGNHDAELKQPKAALILTDYGPILATHGHVGDFINDKFWWLGRWFTRYPWKWMEYLGFKDPAGKFKRHNIQRKMMIEWADTRNHLLLAGHIHAQENVRNYWNIGSGVLDDRLEYLKLENGKLSMEVL